MLFVPYAPPNDPTQPPHQRRTANRFALALFALTALVGLAIKYLS